MILSFIRLFERKILFMKKTKILVPAMAVLALGMAAAVTGTVAWYSSTNVVYARNLSIQSKTAQSLQISLEEDEGWGTTVNHSSFMNADVNPAYCLDAAGTLTGKDAPDFISLDMEKVDNPGDGEGEDKWYVDAAGKVKVFATDALVPLEKAAATNPWKDEVAVAGQYTNVQSDSDWLKLDTTDDEASKTVSVSVKFTRSAKELIDQAMVFGFFNCTTKTWEFEKPFAGETNKTLDVRTLTFSNVTVTPEPSEYKFFMWYDGQDDLVINQNAIANEITATITYSIVAQQNNG